MARIIVSASTDGIIMSSEKLNTGIKRRVKDRTFIVPMGRYIFLK